MPSKWGFSRPAPDPSQVLGDDPLHPHGDVEIINHENNFELRPRSNSVIQGINVDIPEKTMGVSKEEIDEAEAARRLKVFKKHAEFDPNIPTEDLDAIDDAVAHHDAKGEAILVDELVENSPYPEVRFYKR